MEAKKKLPRGRPEGIPQPSGPERIRRKVPVIYDSLLKHAIGGDAASARLCLEIIGEIPPGGIGSNDFVMIGGEKIDLTKLPEALLKKLHSFAETHGAMA